MAKVTEMIGDFAHPAGEGGRGVDYDIAARVAGEMRQVMNLDLDEHDMAVAAWILNLSLNKDQDALLAAWELMNAGERRAWKELVKLGQC